MTLAGGLHRLPDGWLATTVTWLDRPVPRDAPETPAVPGLVRGRFDELGLDGYRALFRRVGSDWLWTSRLEMDDAELARILTAPGREIWTIDRDGVPEALLELDFASPGACEVAFLGLAARLRGQGTGRALIARAVARAHARSVGRLWLHTCTHDDPGAMGFYRRMGFVPRRRAVEVMPDPRLTGLLPPDAAPHVPMIAPAR